MLEVINNIAAAGVGVGAVLARGARVQPASPELSALIAALVEERRGGGFPPPQLKDAVRHMLRAGGFKPSGRSKPASEYLARAAEQGALPAINNLVDINNYLSLLSGLPISLLDAERTSERIVLRFGREDERYVFNSAGQVIDLKGLICVCRGDSSGEPLGTPVKDSMRGKIGGETRAVVGVIYAPRQAVGEAELMRLAAEFARLLAAHGGAAEHEIVLA